MDGASWCPCRSSVPPNSIRTSGFCFLILNSLILYLRAIRVKHIHTHSLTPTQTPSPSTTVLDKPLSQGACNSASSPQRGERRAAPVQSCAPVEPWPAVQEPSASAHPTHPKMSRFRTYSHAPRANHIHSRATCYSPIGARCRHARTSYGRCHCRPALVAQGGEALAKATRRGGRLLRIAGRWVAAQVVEDNRPHDPGD